MRYIYRIGLLLLLIVALAIGPPLALILSGKISLRSDWLQASRSSAGIAPSDVGPGDAILQIYGARVVEWHGAIAIHTWIAAKPRGQETYDIYHVDYPSKPMPDLDSYVFSPDQAPDARWWGNTPFVLATLRGSAAERALARLPELIETYPYKLKYASVPGPNSNTFTAYIIRNTPGLAADLSPAALGKDYIGPGRLIAPAPSGTGYTLSLGGYFAVTCALAEGIEISVLGLPFGVDFDDLAPRLPGLVYAWTG